MQDQRRERVRLVVVSVMFIVTLTVTMLSDNDGWRSWREHDDSSRYTGSRFFANIGQASFDTNVAYLGRSRIWAIGPLETVHMSYETSRHYSIDSHVGEAEWNATLPTGGAIVYLGPHREPFTISMFHQLRCLNIVRTAILDTRSERPRHRTRHVQGHVNHCMNYLRQMVLCRMDTTLESVRATLGRGITVWDMTHTCKDWTAVYEAAERNHRDHS